MKFGRTRNYYFQVDGEFFKLKKYYAEKFSETTSIEIQSQHWGGNIQLSMEGIDVLQTQLNQEGRRKNGITFIYK